MPRDRRINITGGIYHVIVRGIERKDLFRDTKDHEEFLSRLKNNLSKTKSKCFAWVLMSNHVHLMIQTQKYSLTDVMRGLLTGYAVYFNKRYKRHGYLYQNRYKSVLCQEDAYFQELVRYIHLNPLRAKIAKDVAELNNYPWSGHQALIGMKRYDWQDVDGVLIWFSKNKKDAIKKYKEFISDGAGKANTIDFSGGGLVRSAGGWSELISMKRKKEYWRGDQRILGDNDFVEKALKEFEENIDYRDRLSRNGWDLQKISEKICSLLGIETKDLKRKGRDNLISEAKGLVCYFGCKELGISTVKVGQFLGISGPAVSKNVSKGEVVAINKEVKLLN